MSVLGREALRGRIKSKQLVVSPILDSDQIGRMSIDLRMGTVALVVRGGGLSHVDPSQYMAREGAHDAYNTEKGRRQRLERHDLPFNEGPLIVHPGMLILVPTFEWVKIPVDLKGVVTARSSWAREGLGIATATFIDPGYMGIITLELSNVGRVPIAIYPGMRVAQLALYTLIKTESPMAPKDGKSAAEEASQGMKGEMKQEVRPGQFSYSFEPEAGYITKGDEKFVPKFTVTPSGN